MLANVVDGTMVENFSPLPWFYIGNGLLCPLILSHYLTFWDDMRQAAGSFEIYSEKLSCYSEGGKETHEKTGSNM